MDTCGSNSERRPNLAGWGYTGAMGEHSSGFRSNPTIIAAVIGAVASIVAAVIMVVNAGGDRAEPKPAPSVVGTYVGSFSPGRAMKGRAEQPGGGSPRCHRLERWVTGIPDPGCGGAGLPAIKPCAVGTTQETGISKLFAFGGRCDRTHIEEPGHVHIMLG
ncbi:MAG: hypothetical protein HONBIEJF_00552 [Fimbriimonadaceae bacterium]|nr:hypothetical protein [Fimbriimonadaceae bacterium]